MSIEWTDSAGKFICTECGDWWADKEDVPSICECDLDYSSCECENVSTSWCPVCMEHTRVCNCNPYGTCQCS